MSEMLIHGYKVRTKSPDCHPGSKIFNMFVTFDDDISEVLPYLNAMLKGARDYRHKDGILLWDGILPQEGMAGQEEKRHAFRARADQAMGQVNIAVASFKDEKTAEAYAKDLVAMVNDIWAKRSGITPDKEGIAPMPRALDIWKLLPRTNCKKCGFPTCMAYAVAVREDRSKIADCEHLSEDDFKKILPPG